jgi:endothelin-converting enzyme
MAKNYSSVDPCTNFDLYSCDGYIQSHELRPDQSFISPLIDLSSTHRDGLHAILENSYPKNSTLLDPMLAFDEANFKKIRHVYDVCMDETAIQTYGIAPLQKLLDEFDGVYPRIVEKPLTVSSNLTSALVWLSERSISALIKATPGVRPLCNSVTRSNCFQDNPRDPEKKIISFSPGPIRLPKPQYNNARAITNLTKVTSEMFYTLKSGKPIVQEAIPEINKGEMIELASQVVEVDRKLATRIAPPERLFNLSVRDIFYMLSKANQFQYSYQFKPLSQIESLLPDISVTEYLRALVPPGFPLNSNMTVLIRDINFYHNLTSVIQTTSRETMHDYLQYQIITAYAGRLHRNFSLPIRQFENSQSGQKSNVTTARWRACINEIDQRLPHALSGLFVQRFFPSTYRELGFKMIDELKQLFIDRLDGFDWMSNETRKATARKG